MTARRVRVGFIVNFVPSDPPGPWLGTYLRGDEFETRVISARPEGATSLAGLTAPAYASEFVHLLPSRAAVRKCDVLVPWELRATLATVMLRRLTGHQAPIIALNPALKGRMLAALPLVRALMRHVDRIVCFTRAECELQAELLRVPKERIRYIPRFAEVPAANGADQSVDGERFALALGHSNRDFRTLWEALAGTDIRLTMYRGRYVARHPLDNVTALTSLLSAGAEDDLVRRAAFHVLPLRPVRVSAGLTILLRAMAHGRAVIVSDTTGMREYVRDGVNGVIVPAGDPVALRAAMLRLWADPRECARLGEAAAGTVRDEYATPLFAQRLGGVVRELCGVAQRALEPACAS